MGTRSNIGIKEKDNVSYIFCHWDGYLSNNGVILNMFYRDIEKVKKLISLGSISSLGYDCEIPNSIKNCIEVLWDSYSLSFLDTHIKTTFTIPSYIYKNDNISMDTVINKDIPKSTSLKDFLINDEEYNYLFDVGTKKWYLTYMIRDKIYNFELDRLFTDIDYFEKCKKKIGFRDTFEDIKYAIDMNKADLKVSIVKKYNAFLRKNGIKNLEIDYVKGENGERLFGLLKYEEGKQRRKVIMRHTCIGLLCKKAFYECLETSPISKKLTLDEVHNLSY